MTTVPQKALSIFDNLKKLEIQENKIRVIKEGDFEGEFEQENWTLTNDVATYSVCVLCVNRYRAPEFGLIGAGSQSAVEGAGKCV